jgi:hypothetical protein
VLGLILLLLLVNNYWVKSNALAQLEILLLLVLPIYTALRYGIIFTPLGAIKKTDDNPVGFWGFLIFSIGVLILLICYSIAKYLNI